MYRLFAAFSVILIIAAILLQVFGGYSDIKQVLKFFTYFTVFSNLLYLVYCSSVLSKKFSSVASFLHGSSVLCLLITFFGFTILFQNNRGELLTVSNTVLHYLSPLLAIISWIAHPEKSNWKKNLRWLIAGVIYFVVIQVIGIFTKEYPYAFIDPITNGVFSVMIYFVGILFLGFITEVLLSEIASFRLKN